MKTRFLNHRSEILGLTTNDTICLGVEFIFINEFLRTFICESLVGVISLGIVAITMFMLVPIRLKYRPKIIRDTLFYYLKRKKFYAQKTV